MTRTKPCSASSAARGNSGTIPGCAGGNARTTRNPRLLRRSVPGVADAVGTPQVGRRTRPSAAPNHAAFANALYPGAAIRRGALIRIAVPAVLNPFVDVAMHVVKTPGVGWERADRRGIGIPVTATVFKAIGAIGSCIVAPEKRRLRARPCGILPLRLARYPVFLTGTARQPRHIGLRVVPSLHG